MSSKVKSRIIPPWTDEKSKVKADLWLLKKGKNIVTITISKMNRGLFYFQKDAERKLSLDSLQARLTFHQLIDFGYKLQK